MRFPVLPLLTVPVLAGLAGAQAQLTTDGPVGVFVKTGNQVSLRSARSGTPVRPSLTVATGRRGASATTSAFVRGTSVVVRERASLVHPTAPRGATAGTTASTDPRTLKPGKHCFLLTLSGKGKGTLRIVFGGRLHAGAKAAASVDVGADGKVEFSHALAGRPVRKDLPVVLNGTLKVRLCTDHLATLGANARGTGYETSLHVSFLRDTPEPPCRIAAFGRPCHLTLHGVDRVTGATHTITLSGKGAFPKGQTFLLVGTRRTVLRVPGITCPFYTVPVGLEPLAVKPTGAYERVFKLQGPLQGTVVLQTASAQRSNRGLEVRTSNGLLVVCRHR